MSEPIPATAVTPSLEARQKAEMREFVERWKMAGAVLDADRWERLGRATDLELNARAWDVLGLWQADLTGDDGEAICIQQRVFARLASRVRLLPVEAMRLSLPSPTECC